jgi:chitinase
LLRDFNFGYLLRKKIAPVYVGEYGTRFAYPTSLVWLQHWVNYTQGEFTTDGVNDLLPGETGLSWTFWALSPGGDTGGLLESDWQTVDHYKLSFIRKALAPMLPTYDPPIPGIGVNYSSNVSWVVAMPSPQPTMAPTSPLFSYYHTRGHQIVDQHGRSIRLAGLNW